MIRNKLTPSWIIVLLLIGLFHAFSLIGTVGVFAVDYPAVYVDPESTVNQTLTPGFNYTASIMTDYNGTDLWSYQFNLTYNPDVLHITSVENGDVIIDSPVTEFVTGLIDNVAGTLGKTAAYFTTSGLVVPGPGTLATVTFEVVDVGKSNITLGSAVQLNGWNATGDYSYFVVNGITMPDHLGHGFFNNRPEEYHDVSIKSITAPDNPTGGGNVSIDVRVYNGGTFTENATVTVSYNNTLLDSVVIEMENETSQNIEFIWDTYDILANIEANKTYIITANATIVDVDTYPENNNMTKLITLTERHDVSIKGNVEFSPDPAFVGDDINITVTVENRGSYDENVTVITNVITQGLGDINTTILMVEVGKNKTFSFTWETTGLDAGQYDMTVSAIITEDDASPGNNTESLSFLLSLGHEVAVTSIVVSKLPQYVGDDGSIDVNVKNNGPYNETCTVKAFYNLTLIQSKSINVSQGETKSTSFTWNTSGIDPGSYNITAEVILEGYDDVDPSNNIRLYATPIVVKLPPGTIEGTVTDSSSGEAIVDATVTVNGMSATSDSSGAYVISDVPPRNYTVTASADGYEISSKTITLTAGENKTLNFALNPVQPPNILLYAGVAAIVTLGVVAAIAVYILKFRKPKPT